MEGVGEVAARIDDAMRHPELLGLSAGLVNEVVIWAQIEARRHALSKL
jgi:hypothetical protein